MEACLLPPHWPGKVAQRTGGACTVSGTEGEGRLQKERLAEVPLSAELAAPARRELSTAAVRPRKLSARSFECELLAVDATCASGTRSQWPVEVVCYRLPGGGGEYSTVCSRS